MLMYQPRKHVHILVLVSPRKPASFSGAVSTVQSHWKTARTPHSEVCSENMPFMENFPFLVDSLNYSHKKLPHDPNGSNVSLLRLTHTNNSVPPLLYPQHDVSSCQISSTPNILEKCKEILRSVQFNFKTEYSYKL